MIQSNQSLEFAALKEGLKGCGQRVSYQLFLNPVMRTVHYQLNYLGGGGKGKG